jgi:choline dehydrogenase
MTQAAEVDYVVVGAGSSGCVVAARLSESGRHTVCLLEAGGEDDSFWIHAPLGLGKLYDNPKYNWMYEAEPEAHLNGSANRQPRGKVLGGTGSINGMTYMRGHADDYERWRQLGNIGWGFDDVLPYFRKCEDNVRGASHFHGVRGPVRVSDAPRHALADAFISAGHEAGFALNDDFNGASQEGFGYSQMTIRNGRRTSSADAYLTRARTRSNLTVVTHALAARVLLKNGEAVGVEYSSDGKPRTVLARREVILCGGVFNSPQLLQLSGIGPAKLLREAGIEVVRDLPGVGENLQDHFSITMSYRCTSPITINDVVNNPVRRMAAGLQYLMFRTGPMSANASVCAGCFGTNEELSIPNIKATLQLWNRTGFGRDATNNRNVGLAPYSSFGVNVCLLNPGSRGTVRIRSSDPNAHPEIRFNLFESPTDHIASIEALRIMRRIMSMPAMSKHIQSEETPGPNYGTSEELLTYCRKAGRSNHHATSTCKMGVDEHAVVDPRLRVHGIGRLRVADASIMPNIVAGNTHAPAMMIGEKAAAMILEDAGETTNLEDSSPRDVVGSREKAML